MFAFEAKSILRVVLTGSKVKDNLFIIPWSRGIRKYKQYETVKFDVQVWHGSAMNRQCTCIILQLDILQHVQYSIPFNISHRHYLQIDLSVPNHILYLYSSLLIKEPFIFNKYSLSFQNPLLPPFEKHLVWNRN